MTTDTPITPGRPTSWRTILATGCALSAHLEAAHPEARDRRIFHAGSAAHAYLEAILTPEADPVAAVMRLATEGLGDGHTSTPTEPPMDPAAAHEGIDVAEGFLGSDPWDRVVGWDEPIPVDPATRLPEGASAEVPVALDADWRLCSFGSARHRTRLDLVWTTESAGYEDDWGEWVPGASRAFVLDYKSSWRARADADHGASIQRRYQALAALAAYPDADEVVCMIGSLRERRIYATAPIHREHDADLIARWRREIDALEALRDAAQPAPGPGCSACSVTHLCPAGPYDAAEDVVRWAGARAEVARLDPLIRDTVALGGELRAGGSRVYLAAQTRQQVAAGAVDTIADRLAPEGGWGPHAERVASMLAAVRPGVGALRRLVRLALTRETGRSRLPRALVAEAMEPLIHEVQQSRLVVEADGAAGGDQ